MPERTLATVRHRLVIVAALQALTAGLLLAIATVAVASIAGGHGLLMWMIAAVAGVLLAAIVISRTTRQLTPLHVATTIERGVPSLDNLLITTVEIEQRSRTAHPLVLLELHRQTEERLKAIDPTALVPMRRPMLIAITVAVGALIAALSLGSAIRRATIVDGTTRSADVSVVSTREFTVQVAVTPPAYSGKPSRTLRDVDEVEVLEGSRVRLEVNTGDSAAELIEAGRPTVLFTRDGANWSTEVIAERTRFLLIKQADATHERLLAVIVTPDSPPVVRIRQPARDLLLPEPRGRVPVEIEATDDLGLGALSLHYTRVFGSGENVQFQEGELPLRVEKSQPGRWRATSEISLEGLQLADGDTLVYRATTRDLRPGRDPSASESYLLEVGKLAQAASAGFALPEDKDRQALSQQMLIVKTERLHNERERIPRAEFEDRARLLAIEQRMVRAEFVFMTGGEVEDEVAEAEQSHEVVEGRFENEGQVELLAAIREMSRAEARLNDAATGPALEFERAALKALQRAFDRRRYLLRTMPERARIDQTRRLTGELNSARSWRRSPSTRADDADIEALVTLARDLVAAKRTAGSLAALAARVGAIDPNAKELQKAALALSASSSAPEPIRANAIDDTTRLVATRAQRLLAATRAWLPHEASTGAYADALGRQGTKR